MGVLDGLKVLDFTTLLPGPYATMMLADMGADVVKVESPVREDFTKHLSPQDGGVSALFGHVNRSKRSLALNLKEQQARDVIYSLIQDYDIVVEQFRPGVMDRLGIGYEKLKALNPKIIFCSITGYGQTGPLKNRAGHDINYLSLAGIASYSARQGQRPVPAGVQIADLAGGSQPAVIGILAAVYHREQTGEGQHIDISMTDCAFALQAMYGPNWLVGQDEPEAESELLNGGSFYDFYETKDGRYISVGSLEPPFEAALRQLVETACCNGQKLPSAQSSAFKEQLEKAFQMKTFSEWLDLLGSNFDGCVEPVLTFSEAAAHPHTQARNSIAGVPKQNGGYQPQIASPIKFSSGETQYKFIGVPTGTHSEEILQEAGIDREQIEQLIQSGICGTAQTVSNH